ncbi:MAG: glycosyltransferase [Sphingomonas sp.]
MDKLLFGDNQFFGVNHMSEEKARAQSMRFQDIGTVIDVLDAAYDEGVRTFMCTTHDRIGLVADHMRANPTRYADFVFLPCMPYAHKYANAVTEDGMLGALRRFMPDDGLINAALRGGMSIARKDVEGIGTLLIDAEMKMFRGLNTPVVFVQNVVVDLLLGLGFNEAFRIFADHIRNRYGAEPGFITMNMPMLVDVLEELGIENPIVCSNINKIGFRMCGGLEAYERTLREKQFRAIAMSVFASGALPAAEAIEWVCAQPNIESIVFGASSRGNIRNTRNWSSNIGAGNDRDPEHLCDRRSDRLAWRYALLHRQPGEGSRWARPAGDRLLASGLDRRGRSLREGADLQTHLRQGSQGDPRDPFPARSGAGGAVRAAQRGPRLRVPSLQDGPVRTLHLRGGTPAGLKTIAIVHDVERLDQPNDRPKLASIARNCDLMVVHNGFSEAALRRALGTIDQRVQVIPSGNYIAQFPAPPSMADARAALGLPGDALIILFFGNPRREKGLHVLLDAIVDHRDAERLLVVVAGKMKPDEEAEYRAFVQAHGLDPRVRLDIGHVPDEKVASYYRAARRRRPPLSANLRKCGRADVDEPRATRHCQRSPAASRRGGRRRTRPAVRGRQSAIAVAADRRDTGRSRSAGGLCPRRGGLCGA